MTEALMLKVASSLRRRWYCVVYQVRADHRSLVQACLTKNVSRLLLDAIAEVDYPTSVENSIVWCHGVAQCFGPELCTHALVQTKLPGRCGHELLD